MPRNKVARSHGSAWKNERASVHRDGARRSNKYSSSDSHSAPPPHSRNSCWVGGYRRADGTRVEGHYRRSSVKGSLQGEEAPRGRELANPKRCQQNAECRSERRRGGPARGPPGRSVGRCVMAGWHYTWRRPFRRVVSRERSNGAFGRGISCQPLRGRSAHYQYRSANAFSGSIATFSACSPRGQ